MSKNPNYTGNQTYNIPISADGLISGFAPYPVETQSLKQNVANKRSILPDIMRPKNENKRPSYITTIVPESLPFINLNKATPRRSYDPDLPTIGDTQMFKKPTELK